MVWTCEPHGPCDYLSPQWVVYTGIPEEPQLGYGWLQQLHPDDIELTKQRWMAATAAEGPFDTEFRIRRHDGVYRWFKTRAVPARDATGRITKWYGTNTDIQELHDAREGTARLNRDLEVRVAERTKELAAANARFEGIATQLEAAQRLTETGSWELNVSTGDVTWSDELYRLVGLEPGSPAPPLAQQSNFFTAESWLRLHAAIEHTIATGRGYEIDVTVIRTDGEHRQGLTIAEPLFDAEGNIQRIVGTFQDVTERRRSEAQLRTLAQRLQLATSAAKMGVWDWDLDTDTILWDEAMYRLYGVVRDECESSYALWRSRVHPDDITEVDPLVVRAIEDDVDFDCSFRVLLPEGGYRYLKAWAKVHRDVDGKPRRMVGVNWDITEQRTAELALQRTEAFQRTMLAHAGSTIIATDCDGTITLFNRAAEQLLGYSSDEMVGLETPVCFHDLEELEARRLELEGELGIRIERPFDVFIAKVRDGGTDTRAWTYCRKDGSRVPVLLTVTSLRDEDDELIGYLGAGIDLTRQHEQQRALAKSLQEREVLLQEVHHRVKNNLQVISSLINMQMRTLTEAASIDALEECQNRVQSIALIHEKLYQSKDYTRIPFVDYARDLARSVFHASGSSSQRIHLELDIEDVSLPVDKAIPCGLVLNELVTNALKHGFRDGREGTIRIRLHRRHDGQLQLSVSDDGVGLPADIERPTSLGLQLVRTLASQLEGELHIETRAGAHFQLTFPEET